MKARVNHREQQEHQLIISNQNTLVESRLIPILTEAIWKITDTKKLGQTGLP